MGEKIAAIVLAAGEGKRMGSGIPKQYMLIKSRPLVYYALKAFEESAVDEVILVTGEDEIDYCKEYIVDRYHFNKVKRSCQADGNVMHPFILDLKQSRMQIMY